MVGRVSSLDGTHYRLRSILASSVQLFFALHETLGSRYLTRAFCFLGVTNVS